RCPPRRPSRRAARAPPRSRRRGSATAGGSSRCPRAGPRRGCAARPRPARAAWNTRARRACWPRRARCPSGKPLIRAEGEELRELAGERDLVEDLRRLAVPGAELGQLLPLELEHALARDAPVAHPLPDLRAGD